MRSSDTGVVWLAAAASVLAGCGGGGGGNPAPVNAAPTIQNQTYSGTEDVTLAGQIVASDPGDTLSFSIVDEPCARHAQRFARLGAIQLRAGSELQRRRYVSGAGRRFPQSHRNRNDAAGAGARKNDPPAAVRDVIQVDATNAVAVLANDSDVDGDGRTGVAIRGTPLVGTATVNGERTVAIALPPGFKGITKFDYRITDAAGVTADATTQVFVGIAPFSVFYFGVPPGGGDIGIYLDDLFTSRPVHPPVTAATFESLAVSADGSALVYVFRLSNQFQVWYVDVGNLGVQRPAAIVSSAQTVDTVAISPDGRYVATVLRTGASPADIREVQLFDADNSAPPSRITLDPAIHLASYEPKFECCRHGAVLTSPTSHSGRVRGLQG